MVGSVQTIAALTTEADTVLGDLQGAAAITPARVRQLMEDILVSLQSFSQTIPVSTKTTAPYVLTLTDAGSMIEMNLAGANTVQIPTDASVNFSTNPDTVIQVCQLGTGTTTIAAVAPGTTTINSPGGSITTRTQWSTINLRKIAANSWVLSGDLA